MAAHPSPNIASIHARTSAAANGEVPRDQTGASARSGSNRHRRRVETFQVIERDEQHDPVDAWRPSARSPADRACSPTPDQNADGIVGEHSEVGADADYASLVVYGRDGQIASATARSWFRTIALIGLPRPFVIIARELARTGRTIARSSEC